MPRRWTRLREAGRARLHRFRRDSAEPARRQPRPDHAAATYAAGWPQADRFDGRRHDQGRRSVRQGRSRKLLTPGEIDANIAGIRRVFERFLTFGDGPTDAILVNNADWLDALEYISFLREVGKHFTINRMLTFDSVRLRLDREQPLTFLEFNYMILQAYDFLELSRRVGCRMQLGGSDQWGNIVNGIELTRRIDGTEVFGVTSPLITTADGAKMGKTASGAVWLNAELLSPYDYWQFWRNTADEDVGRFLRLFTDLPLDEIARLESLEGAEINQAKIVLATETTAMLHGREAAVAAEQTARRDV